jgi:hypothetical protein
MLLLLPSLTYFYRLCQYVICVKLLLYEYILIPLAQDGREPYCEVRICVSFSVLDCHVYKVSPFHDMWFHLRFFCLLSGASFLLFLQLRDPHIFLLLVLVAFC